MIPVPPEVINILIMLTSVFGNFQTGAIVSGWDSAPLVVKMAYNEGELCGAMVDNSSEHNSLNTVWVDSNHTCISARTGSVIEQNEVLAHEIGHSVDRRCMSDADRNWMKVHRLGYAHWEGYYVTPSSGLQYERPNEAFADAFARAITNTNAYNTVPSWWAQQSALTFFARCAFPEEYYKVFYGYQVFNEIYAPQNSLDYRVGAVMRGSMTDTQAIEQIYKTWNVRNMSTNTYVEHIFTTVLNRNTTVGAERNAWRSYANQHGKVATFELLVEVVY